MEDPGVTSELSLEIVALDDDADFREFIADALGDLGHRVRVARDPGELRTLCLTKLPDLVLLDMNMGEHDGADVLQMIRATWPDLCVIVLTGFPSMESMRETFKSSVFDYLAKPFRVEDLQEVLLQAARALDLGRTPLERLRDQLGRGIRLARNSKGWTLKELSDSSGVSVSQLSSIERGTHLPSLESMVAIAGALDALASEWLADVGL